MVYRITYTHNGRQRVRKFSVLEDALRVAQAIFAATGIVVAVEEVE